MFWEKITHEVEFFFHLCYTAIITSVVGDNMKILVLSDSHSALSFMRKLIGLVKPNAVIHLGDHYDDGEVMSEEFPDITFHQVCGNCDRYRCPPFAREFLCYPVCGVNLYMTHGHIHGVKTGLYRLLKDARDCGAQAVLYGHTHIPDSHQEDDGLWVLNPGSCGSFGGSAGLIEIEKNEIITCRILRQVDLEEMV